MFPPSGSIERLEVEEIPVKYSEELIGFRGQRPFQVLNASPPPENIDNLPRLPNLTKFRPSLMPGNRNVMNCFAFFSELFNPEGAAKACFRC